MAGGTLSAHHGLVGLARGLNYVASERVERPGKSLAQIGNPQPTGLALQHAIGHMLEAFDCPVVSRCDYARNHLECLSATARAVQGKIGGAVAGKPDYHVLIQPGPPEPAEGGRNVGAAHGAGSWPPARGAGRDGVCVSCR